MKKLNKGFTLIELLAVIAILAIILLIAVPKVLSTVATSKTNSARSSAQMVWKAAENCLAMHEVDSTSCEVGDTGFASPAVTGKVVLDNLGTFGGTYTVVVTSGAVVSVTATTSGTSCALSSYTDTNCS